MNPRRHRSTPQAVLGRPCAGLFGAGDGELQTLHLYPGFRERIAPTRRGQPVTPTRRITVSGGDDRHARPLPDRTRASPPPEQSDTEPQRAGSRLRATPSFFPA